MTRPPTSPAASPTEVAAKAVALRRLEMEVTRRLDGLLSGDHLSVAGGPGSERAGARRYEPGDDARRIDWNLTARSLEAHVRTTEADRELETWVVVDRSPSLDFGTSRREKRELVLAALAAFGMLTLRDGNRVGVVVAGGDEVRHLPARPSRAGLMAALSVVYDTPRRERPPGSGADLRAALEWTHRAKHRRGLVVVVSDFLERTDWPGALRRLALRHQVIAVQVTDPRELALAPVGMLTVVDSETGRDLHVQTNSAALRERYAEAAAARHARIGAAIRRSRADHLHLSTDGDWLLDLVRFVAQRAQLRAGVREAVR
jgi:uncharacterized protein (DUF58 family)